jgi:hypothetical protein
MTMSEAKARVAVSVRGTGFSKHRKRISASPIPRAASNPRMNGGAEHACRVLPAQVDLALGVVARVPADDSQLRALAVAHGPLVGNVQGFGRVQLRQARKHAFDSLRVRAHRIDRAHNARRQRHEAGLFTAREQAACQPLRVRAIFALGLSGDRGSAADKVAVAGRAGFEIRSDLSVISDREALAAACIRSPRVIHGIAPCFCPLR